MHGVTTNRDLLVRVLRSPAFLAGEVDTGFLDRHDAAELGGPRIDEATSQLHAVAAALAASAARRRTATPALPTGLAQCAQPAAARVVRRRDRGLRLRREGLRVEVDGRPLLVTLHALTPEAAELESEASGGASRSSGSG